MFGFSKENKDSDVSLKDVLKSVINSIMEARVSADVTTVKIAHIYKNDKLMQSLSVPRVRIDEVDIDFPVVLKNIIKSQEFELQPKEEMVASVIEALENLANTDNLDKTIRFLMSQAENSINEQVMEKFYTNVTQEFQNDCLQLIRLISRKDFINSFQNRLDDNLKYYLNKLDIQKMYDKNILEYEDKSSFNDILNKPVSDFVVLTEIQSIIKKTFIYQSLLDKNIKEHIWTDKDFPNLKKLFLELISDYLNMKSSKNVFKKLEVSPNIDVSVLTQDVKSFSNSDSIMKIKVKLKEDGMEWIKDNDTNTWHFLSE